MYKIKAIQRVILVLDPPVHVDATILAGMPLDGRLFVDGLQLVAVLRHAELVTRYDGNYREKCARRFPAFRAAACVIVRGLTLQCNLDGILGALAGKGPTGKARFSLFHAAIDRRMY